MSLDQYDIQLTYGTVIRLAHLGDVTDNPDGSGNLPIEYQFVMRGRLSRRQINKALRRLVINGLLEAIHQDDPSVSWATRAVPRNRRWMRKNILSITSAPSSELDPPQ